MIEKLVSPLIIQYSSKLLDICNFLSISRRNLVKYDIQRNNPAIVGTGGFIYVDDVYWYLSITGRSTRHWSSLKKKLSFLELIRNGPHAGEFRRKALPSSEEATILRKLLKFKKRPELIQKPLWE